jgi:hypothetical protein
MTGAPAKQRIQAFDLLLVPLAGLEPATCCLGDVSVLTPCRSAKLLVVGERGAKVILWVLAPS